MKIFGTFNLLIILSLYAAYVVYNELAVEKALNLKEQSAPILLYDGVCNMCNGVVNFILDADKLEIFHFASLQSEYGNDLLAKYQMKNDLSTVVLVENDTIFIKSTAALRVAKRLGYPYNILYYTAIGLPSFIRDFGYTMVATSRYVMFGKSDKCQPPNPKYMKRFLGQQNDNNFNNNNNSLFFDINAN